MELKFIKANGTSLEYIEMGQGDPVVFVHGSLGDLRSWSLQIEPFSKLYRAIAYSRRYHYPNAGPGESLDYSVNLHAEDLASLIRGLGLQRSHIVGLSFGANKLSPLIFRHGVRELQRCIPEAIEFFISKTGRYTIT